VGKVEQEANLLRRAIGELEEAAVFKIEAHDGQSYNIGHA
jgi:hypothetical protein